MVITKFSPTLELLARKAYDAGPWFYAYKIKVLSDGGYLISGEVE